MKTNLELKRAAREQLRDNWLMAAVAALVYTIIGSIFPILTGGPMELGWVRYVRQLKNGEEARFETLISGFNDFVRALVAFLVLVVLLSIGLLLLVVPGIVLLCGLSMTFYIMADDKDIDAIAALQKSWNMMRGHKWSYFRLVLRFIGWWLLCIVTFGIAMLWAVPYFELSAMGFYDELKGGYLKKNS